MNDDIVWLVYGAAGGGGGGNSLTMCVVGLGVYDSAIGW